MMNYVWGGLILVSIVFGACTGHMQQVTEAVYSGGAAAVEAMAKALYPADTGTSSSAPETVE